VGVCLSIYLSMVTFSVFNPIQSRQESLDGGSVRRKAAPYTQIEQHKQNKRIQTSMSWVGFEPTISASERTKTVHALDREATVTGGVDA
jgi:hypothetical protein